MLNQNKIQESFSGLVQYKNKQKIEKNNEENNNFYVLNLFEEKNKSFKMKDKLNRFIKEGKRDYSHYKKKNDSKNNDENTSGRKNLSHELSFCDNISKISQNLQNSPIKKKNKKIFFSNFDIISKSSLDKTIRNKNNIEIENHLGQLYLNGNKRKKVFPMFLS